MLDEPCAARVFIEATGLAWWEREGVASSDGRARVFFYAAVKRYAAIYIYIYIYI
jgi:hypothetical protein